MKVPTTTSSSSLALLALLSTLTIKTFAAPTLQEDSSTSTSTSTSTHSPHFFNIISVVSHPDENAPVLNKGYYLQSFHTGAGQSTIVTTATAQNAAIFYLDDSALVQNSSYPFVFSLIDAEPYLSDAPSGYKLVGLQIGSPDQGTRPWTYDKSCNKLKLENQGDFVFAACNVNGTSPYPSVGPQTQLLWRRPGQTQADPRSPPRCADVDLKVAPITHDYGHDQ